MSKGIIKKVAGPPVIAESMRDANIFDVVHVSDQRLIDEITRIHGNKASVQVYEETSGFGPGGPVESTSMPTNAEFRPGSIESVYDGIQRLLDAVMEKTGGSLLNRGVEVPSLKREKKWTFEPTVIQGDKVGGGDIAGTVQEIDVVVQKAMIPVEVQETLTYISGDESIVTNTVAVVTDEEGQEHSATLMRKRPICKGRPYQRELSPNTPLVTEQRVIGCPFPIAKDGVMAAPEPFDSGKTVVQHQLARWADADVVIYTGCGGCGNEMIDVLNEFPELKDPRTGKPLMERTVLIANTSNMPVAAREAPIYTGITITEYFRDMGYSVTLMVDSISRWAEALREISRRLEEVPSEEGYPAYLGSYLVQFYGRADRVISLGSDSREDVLSVIDAVLPAGDDVSEPITQAILHIVKAFWSLGADLAYKRHFPAANWFTNYSLYVDTMEKWLSAKVESDWTELRSCLICLLQEESKLNEIVQLIGVDTLSTPDRLKLEVARSIREDFLYQNAFHETDTFIPLKE